MISNKQISTVFYFMLLGVFCAFAAVGAGLGLLVFLAGAPTLACWLVAAVLPGAYIGYVLFAINRRRGRRG